MGTSPQVFYPTKCFNQGLKNHGLFFFLCFVYSVPFPSLSAVNTPLPSQASSAGRGYELEFALCESMSLCSSLRAGGQTSARRRGGRGRGRRNSSFFLGALHGDRYIRHAQNVHQNSKTFPQKLSITAQRHALTKMCLQKAGEVSLCTSAVMGDSEDSSPLSIFTFCEVSVQPERTSRGVFFLTFDCPTKENILFFRSSCV